MSHHDPRIEDALLTRRQALTRAGMGFGSLALGTLMAEAGLTTKTARGADAAKAAPFVSSLGPKPPQFAPKAKRVIHLFMNGGPSQVDTFDPKPALDKYNGKPIPLDLRTERRTGAAMASPFKFKKYGQSGIEVSDLFANVGECIDDICVIRSMHADVPNHEPSLDAHELRRRPPGPPQHGLVAPLRPRLREPEPPRLRRPLPRGDANRRGPELAVRLPPRHLPGHVMSTRSTPSIEKLIQHIKNHKIKPDAQRKPSSTS